MTTILLRGSVLLAALTFFCLTLNAQPGRGQHHPRPFQAIEQHQEELGITEAQQAELETLKASFRAEAQALRAQEMEPEAKREAMHNLMESLKADLESILTEEQAAQLEVMHKAKKQERRQQFKEARSAVQSYLDQNVKPVMLEQRQKLEAGLSEEDKAELIRLRAAVAEHKAERKAARQATRANGERPQRPEKVERPEREAIRQLVAKYDTQIEALFAEVETEAAQWKSDIEFIMDAHRPEGAPEHKRSQAHKGKRNGQHGKRHEYGRLFNKARFLLMDPAEEAAVAQALIQSPTAFPNPASGQITLQYELQQEAEVLLQLHTREGQLQQEYQQGRLSAGQQQARIDLSQLRDGAYYLSILANGEVQIVPFIVGRQ